MVDRSGKECHKWWVFKMKSMGCMYYVQDCVTVESEADQAAGKCLGCEDV
jgi:hypothetical protein